MKLPKLPFQMMRSQFIGLGILGVIILLFQVFLYFKKEKKEEHIVVEVIGNASTMVVLSDFNPNDLSAEEWQKLGFTEKQTKTILNYKDLLGGEFLSKEQLAKCYAISAEKFAELEKYILLPEKSLSDRSNHSFEKKQLKILGKFNPDQYTQKDWENMGFSQKQAQAILKYKNYLGGSFRSKEKFRECFIISAENYQKMAPYLLLPETAPEIQQKYSEQKPKIQYTYFDPNTLDLNGWQKLGFSEKQAQVIVNYRDKNLKGSFKTLEDVQKCFVISSEKFEELKPWIRLQVKENQREENELKGKEVSQTDFSKVDLNIITFKQLIEFGFDEKGTASFLGFRKKLGGFVNKNQVLETYNLDKNLAKKLIEVSPLNSAKVQKYSLTNAPESFLKNHPYFRKYADKILYYRITYPNDKDIFNKIKATPEEVAKMKQYINYN